MTAVSAGVLAITAKITQPAEQKRLMTGKQASLAFLVASLVGFRAIEYRYHRHCQDLENRGKLIAIEQPDRFKEFKSLIEKERLDQKPLSHYEK